MNICNNRNGDKSNERKGDKLYSYMLSGKALINHLMVRLIERYRYIK